MNPTVDGRMKRWQEQRWLVDAVIRTVGVEFDQPRLAYMGGPGGAEAMADLRMAGQRIHKFDDIAREFAAAARRREAKARAFEDDGRTIAARESYIAAALMWAAARWPIFEVNDTLIGFDERMNACYGKFIDYAPRPIERVEIPFGDASLPAYLHLPRAPAPGERFPCVLAIDGMDACKEIMVSMYGDKLLERDVAVLAIDGPGQGECCTRKIHVTETNHMDGAVAAVDWLCARPDIDADRIAVTGTSFGSFWGTQAAIALGDRIKGCSVSLVCHEPGANTIFNMAAPTFKIRFMFMAGYEDEDEFDRFAQTIDLGPIIADLKCPYLIVAGEDDELSPIECTYELFDRVTAPKKLVVYEGGLHALGPVPSTALGENRFTLEADWLKDRLDGKPAPSEKVFIDSTGRATVTPV